MYSTCVVQHTRLHTITGELTVVWCDRRTVDMVGVAPRYMLAALRSRTKRAGLTTDGGSHKTDVTMVMNHVSPRQQQVSFPFYKLYR